MSSGTASRPRGDGRQRSTHPYPTITTGDETLDQHQYAIETDGLVKHFGETRAVDGVDLQVRAGTVYGVLGPNGAGKTTTIRMLATLIEPTAGTARVLGHDVVAEADAVRGSVSLTGQFASVDEELTGRENLVLLGRLLGLLPAPGRRARGRAARGVRAGRGRRPARVDLLGGHAPAARHRREHRGDPRPVVPRRAHDRARPPQPQPGLGHRASARRDRDHRVADHAVPRGGRPAGRPHRHHRPRPHHRRGHVGRAEGVGRVRSAAGAGVRPRPPRRGRRACWPAPWPHRSTSRPTPPPCRSTASTPSGSRPR